MLQWLLTQGEYFLSILLAALCGAAIGFERENRLKTAGIRTHLIVSIASALMMIVSKYGFYDLLGKEGIGLDPSRIAAGIVTAIGFLGAGIIFIRGRGAVSGLTTAAGIWATVGIGIAIGAGMYLIGVLTTALIIILQWLLHKHLRLIKPARPAKVTIRAASAEEACRIIQNRIGANIHIISIKAEKETEECMLLEINMQLPELADCIQAANALLEEPAILAVEI